MKRFINKVLVAILIVLVFPLICYAGITGFYIITEPTAPIESTTEFMNLFTEPAIDKPITFPDIQHKTIYKHEEAKLFLEELNQSTLILKQEIESCKYTDSAIKIMEEEVARIDGIIAIVENDIALFAKWKEEYYYAAEVYLNLRENGYSAEVSCAIIGNMMAECGKTPALVLDPFAYNYQENGGGLCGWIYYYYPEAKGATFEQQCEILLETIEYQFNTCGYYYRSGFAYNDFLNMTSPEEAARVFAIVYEKCKSFSYNKRMLFAREAYEYFVVASN